MGMFGTKTLYNKENRLQSFFFEKGYDSLLFFVFLLRKLQLFYNQSPLIGKGYSGVPIILIYSSIFFINIFLMTN